MLREERGRDSQWLSLKDNQRSIQYSPAIKDLVDLKVTYILTDDRQENGEQGKIEKWKKTDRRALNIARMEEQEEIGQETGQMNTMCGELKGELFQRNKGKAKRAV